MRNIHILSVPVVFSGRDFGGKRRLCHQGNLLFHGDVRAVKEVPASPPPLPPPIDSPLELYSPRSDLFLDRGNPQFVSWYIH